MILGLPVFSSERMPRAARLLRLLAQYGLLAWSAAAAAQSVPVRPQDGGAAARSEARWLQDMRAAAERLNYVGTIVYQQGGAVRTSRIAHFLDGGTAVERLQLLDGRPREYLRRGDEVRCLFPESRRVLVEQRPGLEVFPALGSGGASEILQRYRVRIGELDRVAGMQCRLLQIKPNDAMRFGYRVCAEEATALPLRAQTLNERGEVIEQIAFADLRLGIVLDRTQLRPSWTTTGWRVDRPEHRLGDLAHTGWQIAVPAGFRKLKEVARRMSDDAADTLQVVYSDGLATLSVFIADGGEKPAATDDSAHAMGVTHAYSRRVAKSLVTVIGEVPAPTVRSVAQSVELRADQGADKSADKSDEGRSTEKAADKRVDTPPRR